MTNPPTKYAFSLLVAASALLAAASLPQTNAQPSGSTPAASAPASPAAQGSQGKVLEVVIDPVAASEGAAGLEKTAASAAAQRDAAAKQPGCQNTQAAMIAADARGGSAAAVRTSVWSTVQDAEAASLAMDDPASGASKQRSASYFRLLKETKLGDGPIGHLEVVVFRTKPGVTREANLALFEKGDSDYAQVGAGEGGLLAHSLWIAPDGRWVHLLYWRSEADYQRTGKALFARPGVGGWIRSLDFKRFTVYRGDVIKDAKPEVPPGK